MIVSAQAKSLRLVSHPPSSVQKPSVWNHSMAALTNPKIKAEYVTQIASLTKVPAEELGKHDMNRLKAIWNTLKPVKPTPVFPPGWKKFDLVTLQHMYVEHYVHELNRPDDGHWLRWRRAQYIMELEFYMEQKIEEQVLEAKASSSPVCRDCSIPMCIRTNRLTQEEFWGCMRFPQCKQTLPLAAAGVPIRMAQIELEKEKAAKESQAGQNVMPRTQRVKRPAQHHPSNSPGYPSSDGSWVPVMDGAKVPIEADSDDDQNKKYNINLTAEELDAIIKKRAEDEKA